MSPFPLILRNTRLYELTLTYGEDQVTSYSGLRSIQLTDVEQEQNGLYTYDRQPKFDPEIIHAIFSRKAAIED